MTFDLGHPVRQDVQIHHGGFDGPMPHKLFDGIDIGPGLQKMGGETVPQGVEPLPF
jgi:hypothetical protein